MNWYMKILFSGIVLSLASTLVCGIGAEYGYFTHIVFDIAGNSFVVFFILILVIGSVRNSEITEYLKDEYPWIAEDEPYMLKARFKVYRKLLIKLLVKTSIISKDRVVNDDLEIKIGDRMTLHIVVDLGIFTMAIFALYSLIIFIINEGI